MQDHRLVGTMNEETRLCQQDLMDIGISSTSMEGREVAWLSGVPGVPGVIPPPADLFNDLRNIRQLLTMKHGTGPEDFTVSYGIHVYRGHRNVLRDGDLFWVLRRINRNAPYLDSDWLRIPAVVQARLLEATRDSQNSGLVLVTGMAGNGKSSTAVAAFRSSLREFGGTGVAIEDPAEFEMNGRIGDNGFCIQVNVSDGDFEKHVRGALRNSAQRVYISEVRDHHTAHQVVMAAGGPFTVYTTMHANSIFTGISRLISLVSDVTGDRQVAASMVANSLGAIIHQSLDVNRNLRLACMFMRQMPDVEMKALQDIVRREDRKAIEQTVSRQINELKTSYGRAG